MIVSIEKASAFSIAVADAITHKTDDDLYKLVQESWIISFIAVLIGFLF